MLKLTEPMVVCGQAYAAGATFADDSMQAAELLALINAGSTAVDIVPDTTGPIIKPEPRPVSAKSSVKPKVQTDGGDVGVPAKE